MSKMINLKTIKEFAKTERHKRPTMTPSEDYIADVFYQAGFNKAQELFEPFLAALEKCCEKEPDGFGNFVAEEFETNAVLEGRKVLHAYKAMIESEKPFK